MFADNIIILDNVQVPKTDLQVFCYFIDEVRFIAFCKKTMVSGINSHLDNLM